MSDKILAMLEQRVKTFNSYADAENDKFTKVFFEGKSEQAQQTIDAIKCLDSGDTQGAIDALNGL